MDSLESGVSSAITAAVENCKDGAVRTLNPADAGDFAAIGTFLDMMGKTPETHPALFAGLEELATSGSGETAGDGSQLLHIVDQGRDSSGRATARVWHFDPVGSFTSGSLALVLDGDTRQPLAFGYANNVGGGLCPAATRSATATAAGKRLTTVGFYHTQTRPGAPPAFGMVAQTSDVAETNGLPATVNDPKSTKNADVHIALGRPAAGADADYPYHQDTNDNPPLLVPFTGNVNVQQPLANLDGTGHFTSGLVLFTQLYNGGNFSNHNPSQDLAQKVTGDPNTNIVSWSFPFSATQKSTDTGPSLVFAPLASANNNNNNNKSAFYFQFLIPVQNPISPTVQFNVCSFDWPDQPSVHCCRIQDLQFWWHCLAAGTLITLADGSTRPVEEVDNRMRVRTGGGANGTLGVEATVRGRHQASQRREPTALVYELKTAAGRRLVLTGGHPVATAHGLVPACDLEPGAELVGEDGPDSLAELSEIEHEGVFCNLKLIDSSDRSKGLGGSVGTFVANGLVVGDFAAMRQAHYDNLHSLDYMLPRIPERYHTDYASTLATIRNDNLRYGGAY